MTAMGGKRSLRLSRYFHRMSSVTNARLAGTAALSIIFLASCSGSQEPATERQNGKISESEPSSSPASRHKGRWTEADVDQLFDAVENRPGPAKPSEFADLRSAANDGVLTAYYALYQFEALDGSPTKAEELFKQCVRVSEPNCLALEAERLHMKGLKEPSKAARISYLSDARAKYEVSLKHSSTLRVASPSTVKKQIADINQALKSEGL